jgi:hypothetical protein
VTNPEIVYRNGSKRPPKLKVELTLTVTPIPVRTWYFQVIGVAKEAIFFNCKAATFQKEVINHSGNY